MNDNKKITISACLVVYNEEKIIERCIKSVLPIVDEIIVVHDGPCQDKTLEIAAKYKAKISIAPRAGEAELIRSLSYEAAQGEWILQIDADEFLSPELQEAIPKLILEEGIDAFEFLHLLYNGQRYLTKTWPYKRCLFRRSAMSYLGTPSNYVVDVKGGVKKIPLVLEHRPNYNNCSWQAFNKKWVPWAKIQADLYLKDFSEINKFNYPGTNWTKKILWRRRFPLIIAPADFVVVVFKGLWSGAYREGPAAWQAAFMWGIYRLIVNWQVFLGKRKKIVEMPDVICPCGHNIYKKYWYDTPLKTISVLVCRNCGLARTWPTPLQGDVLVEYYNEREDYEDYCNRIPIFRVLCQRTIKLLKKWKESGKLLDVGCNLGLFVSEARESGFEARGIDLSAEGIRLGEEKLGLAGLLQKGTISDQAYANDYWDAITYIHCFEHLNYPDAELKEIHRVIKSDGVLLIEVPCFFSAWRFFSGARWYGFSPFQHIWQFGKKGLVSLLERNDFEVLKVYTRVNMYHKASFNLKGFLKIFLKIVAFITGTGDNLIVIARKK